jgi:hypothetical protein
MAVRRTSKTRSKGLVETREPLSATEENALRMRRGVPVDPRAPLPLKASGPVLEELLALERRLLAERAARRAQLDATGSAAPRTRPSVKAKIVKRLGHDASGAGEAPAPKTATAAKASKKTAASSAEHAPRGAGKSAPRSPRR